MPAEILLSCDETLTSTYRNIPLLDFLGCAPVEKFPASIYRMLDTQLPHENGVLTVAPYSLRKAEVSFVCAGYDTLVVHPCHITGYLTEDTRIVGISTMDPMGMGPVSMMFTGGGRLTPYTKKKFWELIHRVAAFRERKGYGFRIIVGGPGAWQLCGSSGWEESGIDHIVLGEIDGIADEIVRDIEDGHADEVINIKRVPAPEEIPAVLGPTYKGMVEVMRGCGRNCRYCDPNLRRARYIPEETIRSEIAVNVRAGLTTAWLHSDDIFLYKIKDRREFYPNTEEVVRLFERVMSIPGVQFSNPTHGTIAPVVADPSMIQRISHVVNAGPSRWVGIQMGLETASPSLMAKYMEKKVKPFTPDEWPGIVIRGTQILNENYWFPAYTAIIGLPGETGEDLLETASLILTMETVLKERIGKKAHFTVTPLSFVPMGSLKGVHGFDIQEELTEEAFLLIYHSWKHLLREISSFMLKVDRYPAMIAFYPLARFGVSAILNFIRRWGIRRGYDPDRKIPPLDVEFTGS